MFYNCKTLINIDLSSFNISNVTNMINMSKDCIALKKIDLSNFNTQNVIHMYGTFKGCNSLINNKFKYF